MRWSAECSFDFAEQGNLMVVILTQWLCLKVDMAIQGVNLNSFKFVLARSTGGEKPVPPPVVANGPRGQALGLGADGNLVETQHSPLSEQPRESGKPKQQTQS